MSNENLKVEFIDLKRYATHAADPQFPNGIDLDVSKGQVRACQTELLCPAPRCGYWLVKCDRCDFTALITTAGRADDPRSIKVPCK